MTELERSRSRKQYFKEYRQKNRVRISANFKKFYLENRKRLREKAILKSRASGVKPRNKNFNSEEYHKLHNKEYHKKNAATIKKRKRLWRDRNRLLINAKVASKRRSSIQLQIYSRLQSRIRIALKSGKTTKTTRTVKLLGCSLAFFKDYIESKFTSGMTWLRFSSGEIHLDHIRPCASFDLSKFEQQSECFCYKNLQPLWAEDNLRKKDQWPYVKQPTLREAVLKK